MYSDYNRLTAQIETLKIDSEILNDPDKLRIYIEEYNASNQRSFALFETTAVFDVTNLLNLKPQYAEYINRYGYPIDFQFEADKMAIVIYDLVAAGIMNVVKSAKKMQKK